MKPKKQIASPKQPQPVAQSIQLTAQTTVHRSGPLPDPVTLKEYDDILPGAAGRIFLMAEKDQAFHHSLHLREQATQHRTLLLGQVFGFLLGVMALAGAVFLSVNGLGLAGAAVFIGAVATLISAAVWAKRPPRKDPAANQPRFRG